MRRSNIWKSPPLLGGMALGLVGVPGFESRSLTGAPPPLQGPGSATGLKYGINDKYIPQQKRSHHCVMTLFDVGVPGFEPGTLPLQGAGCATGHSNGWNRKKPTLKQERSHHCVMTPSDVGVPGFEPGTPCSQSRCATGLRYTPKLGSRMMVHSGHGR